MKKPDDEEQNYIRFDFRPNTEQLPEYMGLNLHADPAAIQPGQFVRLENIRIKPAEILRRYGQTKVFTIQLSSYTTSVSASSTYPIIGMYDTRLFVSISQRTY